MSIKRILFSAVACLLLCAACLSLTACGDGYYDPIKSSRRDRRVVMELGEEEISFELFRYLFMSRIDTYDDGDRSRWQGDSGAALWKTAESAILDEITEIYAVFAVCRKWGIDPYGDNIEKAINESIKLDIDGGYLSDGTLIRGFGSVDAYKTALAKAHCTDAVRRLLYRYKACLESLDSYIVSYHAEGKVTITDAELLAFAESDKCVHINQLYVSFESFLNNRDAAYERIQNLRRKLLEANGNYDVMVEEAFSQSLAFLDTDPKYGIWYGPLSISERDYPTYYKAIFAAVPGEISEIIEEWDGYYVIYGMDREVDLEDRYVRSSLTSLYLEEMYWGEIHDTAVQLKAGATQTKHYVEVSPAALMAEND